MSKPYAAIVGGAVGVALVAAFIILWFFKSHCKNFSNKNSETGSSDPSALEWSRGGRSSSAPSRYIFGSQGARQFTMDELEQATKQFSDSNLIGYGSFGSVYKGLLHDSVVAIKRRPNVARDDFVAEVIYLSEIRHRNLVSLLGYCKERGSQMLVFEYVPNGSMCNHLYDRGLESSTKLEFKQRLSIALGAAKGLCHLHSLNPPLVHKNFRMANVLVDENFIVKVADAGISKLLEKIEEAGPSFTSGVNVFQDPETEVSGTFTEMSDVYSFGVFLLELLTGQEAVHLGFSGTDESLIQWVASRLNSNSFVDRRLMGSFTRDGIRDLIRLTLRCMSFPGTGRPKMEMVVAELERIHDREMELTTVMGEGTATFLKGSELFT
ncbi:proline-rich receptor-like protein kinase PERK13 isoform X1 [Ricinus communis]|uniref:proline-rich receptor-like protein kinase PERK13 isoform X1 n=2 Tax=Ricinus communis TaxID=3988 RepID=UPI000772AEDB|nr:proline-rich receptor-like protein kinase PERK13 isoform X1 [Ricinus communis]XP_048235042.1 proline-rich receptor-like protein kinase PERK13 isoform X1 [Ricinus communis]XP_048235043.1 proline-rich receptor-like protein kinase PERK13 isoform X1 [Ricinus communis]XP_048235045.1 proline-rich receptor-like protein kinase PERK13 isoform X1 [Ricinus communis]XP_048235046.1 proline-rich receptor-like protein kinase PERK13 isoform X1 [Ricinus communis]XP_048235047.1 proline-rich receptor-like pro|eukprot:XP_025012709.1 proline-rich receptor-like protein kinase PERK13 isoform X2 [Ricinus communis]